MTCVVSDVEVERKEGRRVWVAWLSLFWGALSLRHLVTARSLTHF